jgi:glutamate N-acetyltransferase/amino-acid N-acetyltransferase
LKQPLGYRYATSYAGIRKVRKDDLTLIISDPPASAAAMFTTNRVQAAPVRLARKHLSESGGVVRAVLVNAGNANCATRTGDRVAAASCRALAKELGVRIETVIPASTGVIGVELDAGLLVNSLPALVEKLREDAFDAAAQAIMTTDLVPKTAFAETSGVRVAGMTKGSGMIHPNMATTLAFVMTDAGIAPPRLKVILKRAVERSFHRLSVDGDTSTNDMVLLLANGASGIAPRAKSLHAYEEAVGAVLEDLAKQIARDGEGAKKLITIDVEGARSNDDAARIARAIANSPLVKTAIAGSDPNWGRILSAAGYSGVIFEPSKTDVYLQGTKVCRGGLAAPITEDVLKQKLDSPECWIRFVIRGGGTGEARFYTCDLTKGYIDINASYRT